MKGRGYTLVEAAIVLTAFLLLVGGMAWPVAQRIRIDQDASERAYMEAMKEAVVAYAMRNRTLGGTMEVDFTAVVPGLEVNVNIPSGRPYLPCPDTDGDGLENRVSDKVSAVMEVDVGTTQYQLDVPKNEFGMCTSDRGLFPWRTLGTKPYDYWGRNYDYHVHRLLASPFFGFDETSGAAPYMSLLAISAENEKCLSGDVLPGNLPGNSLGLRSPTNLISKGGLGYAALELADFAPTVVGRVKNHSSTPGMEFYAVEANKSFYASFLQDSRRLANGSGDRVNVFRHCWVPNSVSHVIGGVAFAIVSHGRNGYGGVRYDNARTPGVITTSDCLKFPSAGASTFHGEKLNGDCQVSSLNTVNSTNYHLLAYDSAAPPTGVNVEFDDLVVWMMPRQLFSELAKEGAMPKPPPLKIVEL